MTDRALELDTQTVLPGDALANLRGMEAESRRIGGANVPLEM